MYFDRIRNNRKRLTLVRLAIVPRSPGVVRNLLPLPGASGQQSSQLQDFEKRVRHVLGVSRVFPRAGSADPAVPTRALRNRSARFSQFPGGIKKKTSVGRNGYYVNSQRYSRPFIRTSMRNRDGGACSLGKPRTSPPTRARRRVSGVLRLTTSWWTGSGLPGWETPPRPRRRERRGTFRCCCV